MEKEAKQEEARCTALTVAGKGMDYSTVTAKKFCALLLIFDFVSALHLAGKLKCKSSMCSLRQRKGKESCNVNVQKFLEYLMGRFIKSSVLVQFICIYSVGGRIAIVKYCLPVLTFKKKKLHDI